MSKLRVAADLALPLDAVTQAIGIIAKRRAGKSYTARRFVEQLVQAGQQVVIADPKGDWWGIRSAADGKAPGLQVIILGGERGDLPLEVGAGEVIAKLVTEERVSVLLDLSLFRKHEVATFMTAFLEGLYRLKAREEFRTPVMLVIDEADAIAPQKPQPNEARMLGAAEDIVRRGGQRGIGCMMITQRSAVLNKNVLTQVEVLIALRTIAPQDLKALDAWVEVHGEEEQRNTLMASLPSLPVGDAWVWSPGWPTSSGIFKRVHVLPIETFDSGASPKAGEKRAEPKKVADVDLGALQRQMADTIEKAKANDPKELRKRIAELERDAAKKAPAVAPVVDQRAIDRAVASAQKDVARRLGLAVKDIRGIVHRLSAVAAAVDDLTALGAALQTMQDTTPDSRAVVPVGNERITTGANHPGVSATGRSSHAPARPAANLIRSSGDGDASLPKGERICLTAIASYDDGVERDQLSILSGFKRSTRDAYVQRLVGKALAEIRGASIVATQAGIDALGADFEPLPTGSELAEYWLARLPEGERKVLAVLLEAGGDSVSRDELSASTGYKRSTRDAYIQRLGTRRLITTDSNGVRARAELFD